MPTQKIEIFEFYKLKGKYFYQYILLMKHTNFKDAQTHYEFVLGPIKIKDGLFMGDQLAAKDIQFIISNKVTHVINTVSKVIPNLWERFGIQYLSVNWTQKQQNIFDKKNNAVNAIFHFVQQAMQQGQSCLIHSMHGKSRSCAVMVAYMMKKYNWTLNRCLEFIKSKKQHLQIRDNYLSQMQQLQKRMMQMNNLSADWNLCKNQQQMILKNTFINSKAIQFTPKQKNHQSKKRVQWGQKIVIPSKPTNPSSSGLMATTMTRFKQSKQKKHQAKKIKSILKGQQNSDQQNQSNLEDQNMIATDTFPMKKDNNFINTINGNIVHVTVNNFITTDKKHQIDKSHLTRPYSSDNKQRLQKQMKAKLQPKKNLFLYDTSFKSPYDSKLTTKIGSNNKLTKKKQQIKNPIMAYQRPQSANIAAQRRKIVRNVGSNYFDKKQDMMVTGKKRYPSTNPRDDLYKWK